MDYLKERVAYLKGLAEGLKLDETKEGRVLKDIVEVLDEFADAICTLSEEQDEVSQFVDEIDEDLSELEESYYELDDECGCECDDEQCHCHNDEEEEYYEVECPNCKDSIVIDEEWIANKEIICPNCKSKIDIRIKEQD